MIFSILYSEMREEVYRDYKEALNRLRQLSTNGKNAKLVSAGQGKWKIRIKRSSYIGSRSAWKKNTAKKKASGIAALKLIKEKLKDKKEIEHENPKVNALIKRQEKIREGREKYLSEKNNQRS